MGKYFTALVGALLLAGCATTTGGGFSTSQVLALQAEGFVQTDEGWELSIADRLLFDHDSAALNPEMSATIGRVAASLLRIGIESARIEGHTDSDGADDYNLRLSEQRASAVAAAMQARGFSSTNLILHGWGETRAIATNASDEGRAQNRRVAIIVTATDARNCRIVGGNEDSGQATQQRTVCRSGSGDYFPNGGGR